MAGKEASGTGNMKFALNGAITVGTLDGANVEILRRVGADNFFLFGLTAEEVLDLKHRGYQPRDYLEANWELMEVIGSISAGEFSGGDKELFKPIVDTLLQDDPVPAACRLSVLYPVQRASRRGISGPRSLDTMSIRNVARCGFFSSDRSMRQYCEGIWKVQNRFAPSDADLRLPELRCC